MWLHLQKLEMVYTHTGTVCSCSLAKSCPTLWDPMDCSPPGSSVHGISQARILELVTISCSRGSFQPRDQILHWQQSLYHWTTREAQWDSIQPYKRRKPCHVRQHGWTWRTLCWVKQATHKKRNAVRSHSHGESKTPELMVTERRMVVPRDWASLAAQTVKNLPAVQETRVWSLGWEDPLEEGMATHSSILAWRVLGTEEPGGLQSMRLPRVIHEWLTHTLPGTGEVMETGTCWLKGASIQPQER